MTKTAFVGCPSCARHVREGEELCPFCGVDVRGLIAARARRPERKHGFTRLAIVAGTALLGSAIGGCGGSSASSDETTVEDTSGGDDMDSGDDVGDDDGMTEAVEPGTDEPVDDGEAPVTMYGSPSTDVWV